MNSFEHEELIARILNTLGHKNTGGAPGVGQMAETCVNPLGINSGSGAKSDGRTAETCMDPLNMNTGVGCPGTGHNAIEESGIGRMIAACLDELEKIVQFQYLFKYFESPPEFLKKDPYRSFLSGSKGIIISAMTLGSQVDRLIKRLSMMDAARGMICDCCASVLIEHLSDEYEKTLGRNLSYRFCPGYGGSDVSDLKYIFEILRPEKIGLSLSDSFFILPSKSMAGIIAVGKQSEKTCANCFMAANCQYLKEGKRCY